MRRSQLVVLIFAFSTIPLLSCTITSLNQFTNLGALQFNRFSNYV